MALNSSTFGWILLFVASRCVEYDIKNDEEEVQIPDTAETESETFIPPDCIVDFPDVAEVPIDEECVTPEYNIQNPWNVEIEWQWNGTNCLSLFRKDL